MPSGLLTVFLNGERLAAKNGALSLELVELPLIMDPRPELRLCCPGVPGVEGVRDNREPLGVVSRVEPGVPGVVIFDTPGVPAGVLGVDFLPVGVPAMRDVGVTLPLPPAEVDPSCLVCCPRPLLSSITKRDQKKNNTNYLIITE